MARREVPTREVLKANMQKINSMHDQMRSDCEKDKAKSVQDPYGSFQEHLTCIVCFDLADQPFSCPKCQHIVCRSCLEQWFQTPVSGPAANAATTNRRICPGCRQDLGQSEITTSRLAESLIQAMKSQERIYCGKHDSSEVIFYCESCDEPLCSDAIVEDQVHRQHDYVKLQKVYSEAKSKIDSLLEKFTDLSYECHNEIASFEKLLIDERYKNELKLSEFMKTVDEQLQQFQADEERECARLHRLVAANQERMSHIKEVQQRVQTRLDQLTKVELVRQANTIIENIQSDLQTFEENKVKSESKSRHKDSDV